MIVEFMNNFLEELSLLLDSRPPDQMGFVQFLQAHLWLVRQFSSWFTPKRSSASTSKMSRTPRHSTEEQRIKEHSSDEVTEGVLAVSSRTPNWSISIRSNNIRHTHGHTNRRRKRNHHLKNSDHGSNGPDILDPLDPQLQHFSGHPHSTETPTFGKILGMVPICECFFEWRKFIPSRNIGQ